MSKSQIDSANVALITDDRDDRQCNACMDNVPAGESHFQLRIQRQYIYICAHCGFTVFNGLGRGLSRITAPRTK